MIIQAIPASGKTYGRDRYGYVDSDDLLSSLNLKGKAGYETAKSSPELKFKLASLILSASGAGKIVVCNFDATELGLVVDRRFAYKQSEYVKHIELAGRVDLLEKFSADELSRWAASYETKAHVTWLRAGQFLPALTLS